jgi:outer membrane protein OmpU
MNLTFLSSLTDAADAGAVDAVDFPKRQNIAGLQSLTPRKSRAYLKPLSFLHTVGRRSTLGLVLGTAICTPYAYAQQGSQSEMMGATPLNFSVNGFFYTGMAYVDRNDDYTRNAMSQDAEIHFNAETVLDNGVRFGLQVQVEAQDEEDNDPIDEAYVYIDGAFGRFTIGAENDATYLSAVQAPTFIAGMRPYRNRLTDEIIQRNLSLRNDADTGFAIGPGGLEYSLNRVNMSTLSDQISDDELKIIYFSPRVGGFRGSVSYSANNGNPSGGRTNVTKVAEQDDIYSYAIDYHHAFNEKAMLDLSFGVTEGDNSINTGTVAYALEDPKIVSYGASLMLDKLTIGGNYTTYDNHRGVKGQDIDTLNMAVKYDMGRTSLGISYTDGNDDGVVAVRSSVDYQEWVIGGQTHIAPGVSVGYFYQDAQADYSANQSRDVSLIGLTLALQI